jgi:hypothetical protein
MVSRLNWGPVALYQPAEMVDKRLAALCASQSVWRKVACEQSIEILKQQAGDSNMKKILNQPADFVPEMLEGLLKGQPTQLAVPTDLHCIVRADAPVQGKVALATAAALATFLSFWAMSAKACWMAVRSATCLPPRVPSRCWR